MITAELNRKEVNVKHLWKKENRAVIFNWGLGVDNQVQSVYGAMIGRWEIKSQIITLTSTLMWI